MQEPEPASTDDLAAAVDRTHVDADWRRVSPRYMGIELVSTILAAVIIGGAISVVPFLIGWQHAWIVPTVIGALAVLEVVITPRRVRAIGYRLRDDDLLFRRGIAWRRQVAVPYGRMQLVDINRGPLARAFGLSELKLVTASASSNVTIPGLAAGDAEALRDHLVALAETRRVGL